jgi:hypothetical protein
MSETQTVNHSAEDRKNRGQLLSYVSKDAVPGSSVNQKILDTLALLNEKVSFIGDRVSKVASKVSDVETRLTSLSEPDKVNTSSEPQKASETIVNKKITKNPPYRDEDQKRVYYAFLSSDKTLAELVKDFPNLKQGGAKSAIRRQAAKFGSTKKIELLLDANRREFSIKS